ncbi:MAG: hypothetical protein KF698_08140 [Anaerolineales bacterium]|nr:hypothetical protein [Anaerolineales bacterium]
MDTQAYKNAQRISGEELQNVILGHLRLHVGKHVAITDEYICQLLGKPISFERAVRMAINKLRKRGELICSESGVGYWMASSLEEALHTSADLRSRATDMFDTANTIEQSAQREFGGQRSLV